MPFLSKALPPAEPGCRLCRAAICVSVKLERCIIREKGTAFLAVFSKSW